MGRRAAELEAGFRLPSCRRRHSTAARPSRASRPEESTALVVLAVGPPPRVPPNPPERPPWAGGVSCSRALCSCSTGPGGGSRRAGSRRQHPAFHLRRRHWRRRRSAPCPLRQGVRTRSVSVWGQCPLKPPMAMTALPLSRMNGAAVWEPFTATRYWAEPWCRSRKRTQSCVGGRCAAPSACSRHSRSGTCSRRRATSTCARAGEIRQRAFPSAHRRRRSRRPDRRSDRRDRSPPPGPPAVEVGPAVAMPFVVVPRVVSE